MSEIEIEMMNSSRLAEKENDDTSFLRVDESDAIEYKPARCNLAAAESTSTIKTTETEVAAN